MFYQDHGNGRRKVVLVTRIPKQSGSHWIFLFSLTAGLLTAVAAQSVQARGTYPQAVLAAASQVYYSDTIQNIILSNCARCHSGASRNLMDYDNLKAYADSGVLGAMVQGPMAPFAGSDASTILAWIDAGAPEKPSSKGAATSSQKQKPAQTRPSVSAGPFPSVMLVKAQKVYYSDTIQNIIQSDCSQCHSGASRNLMDYDNLKAYADSGILAIMVQGPMSRFAGNDAPTILAWIDSGAPEKPQATTAAFPAPACPTSPGTFPGNNAAGPAEVPITYENTIQYVIAGDCLRCHAGPFRNLTTYENVKMYVDNGLLKTLVQPGGQMHRFAGPDARLFLIWIRNGAPRGSPAY